MLNLAKLLKSKVNSFATIITTEMGKPIVQARREVEKCAWLCEHYAESGANYLQPKLVKTKVKKSYITYKPLGVIFAIMPWNFPFWQIFRFAVPTIMAGNAVIIKHAPNCIGASLAIERLFIDAGFMPNVFNNLIIDVDLAAEIIKDERVAGVSLTGSARAGSIVAANAAAHLKKVVLELGGSDPYIVLADADLNMAAEFCLNSRLANTGQVCIAAKRLIVLDAVMDKFKTIILSKIKKLKMGDPFDEENDLGPLARLDLRANLHRQVEECIALGAKCLLGGTMPDPNQPGFYYPLTVLENIKPNMPAYKEELFGPVVCLFNVANEDAAINLANDSPYGLAAAIFTADLAKGENIANNRIKAGTVVVNGLVASDPRLPFGGIKTSGYGRELGQEGMHEFVNIKTVVVS